MGCAILLESISVICLCVFFAPLDIDGSSFFSGRAASPGGPGRVLSFHLRVLRHRHQGKTHSCVGCSHQGEKGLAHLNRIKAKQELRDAVNDTVTKLRHKLDMSVPSLGKYKVSVAKPRLPKDKDKEQVLIQKQTSAKPVSDNVGCHPVSYTHLTLPTT